MQGRTPIIVINTINLVLIALLIYYGFKVITKYMLRMGICMVFVNMFYILSALLLLSDLFLVYAVYFELPDKDPAFNMSDDIPVNVFTVVNSAHSVIYIALVLLMVGAMVQITTGLKLTYYQKLPMSTKNAICNLYLTNIVLVSVVILVATIEAISFSITGMTQEVKSIVFLCLGPFIMGAYIFSLCKLVSYMNTA